MIADFLQGLPTYVLLAVAAAVWVALVQSGRAIDRLEDSERLERRDGGR